MMQRAVFCLYFTSFLLGVRTKDPATIMITGQGPIVGKEVLVTRQRATVYLGVPFAAPPTGELRFAPPQTDPLPSWTEIRNASIAPPACIQDPERLEKDTLFSKLMPKQKFQYSEDCLYLNIYVPDGSSPAKGWPVMVWLHSGDFNSGATSMWDGSALAIKQKVIVVTVAYRLNIFGFFTLTDGHAPGNYGLMDQVAALDWIKEKISDFGGSPADVCLFGHGSGATSIGLHMVSPLSAGKFARAIAMSGSAVGALKNPVDLEIYVKELGEKYFCDPTPTELMECLRRLKVESLVSEAVDFGDWGPVLDRDLNTSRPFLPDDPQVLFKNGQFHHIAYMTGYTDMEDALVFKDIKDEDIKDKIHQSEFEDLIMEAIKAEYPENAANDSCQIEHAHILDSVLFYYSPEPPSSDPKILLSRYMDFATDKKYASGVFFQATHASKYNSTFLYRFEYKAKSLELPEWAKVPNQYELPFIWGMPYWTSITTIWNGADRKMADQVMSLWANFAKTGNTAAQTGASLKWDNFTQDMPTIMILDRNSHMVDTKTFDYKAFSFWNSYYPKVVEASNHCCNATDVGVPLHANLLPPTALALFALQYRTIMS